MDLPRGAPYVGVVGAGECDGDLGGKAERVGGAVARAGAILVCGGLGGVMEAACRGAKAAGGTTIGLLPGDSRSGANAFVDVVLATGLGEMRNVLIARTADVLIAIGGGFGTLSEIGFGLKLGKPVVGLETWELRKREVPQEGIVVADDPERAVALALRLLQR